MKRFNALTFVIAMLVASSAVLADWNVGDPFKWLQPPDLEFGMDVRATQPKILADDFLCTQTGPITDIHIWGSWLDDRMNPLTHFDLAIYKDIPDPDGPTGPGYSQPGERVWARHFMPTEVHGRVFYEPTNEYFYDPNVGQIIGTDTQVWQYNFFIDPADAFIQQGTAAAPQVYWVSVLANVEGTELFGWKTSRQHWNDDAVWADTPTAVWHELRYPPGHPLAGQSIDLAFVITPEPATMGLLALGGLALLKRKRQS